MSRTEATTSDAAAAARFRRIGAVFDEALDLPERDRTAFVRHASGSDAGLRGAVLELLHAYERSTGFMDVPAPQMMAPVIARAGVAAAPARIGAFRIVREIGRGGMGTVYLAERDDGQFEQRVAIKLIHHAGPESVRRFIEERRILALLEHPGIARLVDGGITENGLPYFAMELIDGDPIDTYCAQRNLSVEQRLELVVRVGDAVSYAHQHLVIHRDLKPSNILVTPDGRVKLLDFGIAKLLAQPQLAGGTTRTDLIALTPEYAAPEQVRGAPVSTATDVYALGVLLYVLLTGTQPYDVRGRGMADAERIICSEDPPRPSSRVATALARRLRGDLDRIVLTALRKEPGQRYASVRELAEDLRRHLSGHPVHARRKTISYRASRFLRRHAWGVAAASTLVLLVSSYAVSMTIQHDRVERALEDATVSALKAEQVTDFMLGLFQASERGQAFADTLTARALLQRAIASARALSGRPEVQAQMLDAVGQIHMQLGEHDDARIVFAEALAIRRGVLDEEHLDIATSLANVAAAANRSGDHASALTLREQALTIRRRVLGSGHPLTLDLIYWQGHTLHQSGSARAAVPLFDEWVAGVAALPLEVTTTRATQYLNLGQFLSYNGDHEAAQRVMSQAVDIRRNLFGERHSAVARALSTLAGAYLAAGRIHDSERAEREAVAILRDAYPDGHPDLADAIRGLAVSLHRLRRWDEAEPLYLEQRAMVRRFFGEDHLHFATASEDLGLLLYRRGEYDRAEPLLREAARVYRARVGEHSLLTRRTEVVLGDVLRATGRLAEAEPLLLAGHTALSGRSVPGFDFARVIAAEGLARLHEEMGHTAEAARYRALARRD